MSGGLSFIPVGWSEPRGERLVHAFAMRDTLLPLCWDMGKVVTEQDVATGYILDPDPERLTCPDCIEWMHA